MPIPGLENLNFNLGISYSGFARTGLIIGETIIFFLLVALITYMIVRRISYTHKVYILAKRGGKTISISEDRARIFTKDGITKMVFASWLRRKLRLPAPSPEMIYNGARGKPCIFLYKYGDKDYTPIKVKEKQFKLFTKEWEEPTNYKAVDAAQVVSSGDDLGLEPIPSFMDMWNTQIKKDQVRKFLKPTFLEKYGPQVIMVFAIIAVVVMIWMTLGKIDDVAQALNSAASTAQQSTGQKIVSSVGGALSR